MASRQQQVAAEQQRQRWPQQHQPQQQQEPSSPDWATTVTATPRSPTTATTAMTWGASFGGATPLAGVTPQSLAAQVCSKMMFLLASQTSFACFVTHSSTCRGLSFVRERVRRAVCQAPARTRCFESQHRNFCWCRRCLDGSEG